MKYYVRISFFLVCSSTSMGIQELADAIKSNDLKEVKKIMSYRQFFSPEQKSKLRKTIQKSIALHKDITQTLFKSPEDVCKIIGGTVAMVFGIGALLAFAPPPKPKRRDPSTTTSYIYQHRIPRALNRIIGRAMKGQANAIISIAGLLFAAFGGDQILSGWKMKTALNNLDTALAIERELELHYANDNHFDIFKWLLTLAQQKAALMTIHRF